MAVSLNESLLITEAHSHPLDSCILCFVYCMLKYNMSAHYRADRRETICTIYIRMFVKFFVDLRMF